MYADRECNIKSVSSAMIGQVRRYQAPDEHPFFPEDLPEPILPSLPLSKVSLNLNLEF